MTRWRAYYDDGSTFDGPVEDAPGDGVVGIVRADEALEDFPYTCGRELLYGKDHYWWESDRWLGGDTYGRDDYLRRPGWRKVIAGRTLRRVQFEAIKHRMETDPEFPVMSARG